MLGRIARFLRIAPRHLIDTECPVISMVSAPLNAWLSPSGKLTRHPSGQTLTFPPAGMLISDCPLPSFTTIVRLVVSVLVTLAAFAPVAASEMKAVASQGSFAEL